MTITLAGGAREEEIERCAPRLRIVRRCQLYWCIRRAYSFHGGCVLKRARKNFTNAVISASDS